MPKKDGKYIVFCSGMEHLNEMVDMYSKWFMMVDKKPNIYRGYYNDQENSKAFKGKRKIFDGLQQINYQRIISIRKC